jgi:hypothetical protein
MHERNKSEVCSRRCGSATGLVCMSVHQLNGVEISAVDEGIAFVTHAPQNTCYPRHDRTLGATMNRLSSALGSDAMGDRLREFTPDMKRLFRKHAPRRS